MTLFFSFAGTPARLCKPLKRGGPTAANENHQPYRARGVPFLSNCLLIAPIPAPQGSVLFAHRRLPMGKKGKTLCDLRASVVKYPIKNTLPYL